MLYKDDVKYPIKLIDQLINKNVLLSAQSVWKASVQKYLQP